MQVDMGAFQSPQQETSNPPPDYARHNRMTPARRAALDALEREFAELMSLNRSPQCSQEVEHRINVARRLLDIADVR